jgi:protein TonB
MTTAEFIFPQPSDSILDRKQEFRKVLWAFLVALLLHLLVAFGLAAFGGAFTPVEPVTEEEKPMEMTVVDLPTPAPTRNTAFIENDESKQAPQPKEKTFESNANSVGASQLPATGNVPLPSQEGKERPWMDLETHSASIAQEGAQPQPNSVAQETPQPSQPPQATPETTPITDSEQFALNTSTPQPSIEPSAAPKPQQPHSAYRPEKQQTRLAGSITNRGASAVNAIGTPLGQYQKMLYDAVGSRWYLYVARQRDLLNIGTLRLVFTVDREGRPQNLKVAENSSNEAFANVCLQSVMEIQLPPIPEDVASTLPSEGLDEEMSFTMYAN